jgi:hypothetical protein
MDINERNRWIEYYYDLGMSHRDIVFSLSSNQGIIISERHLRRILKMKNLCRRNNYSDIGTVTLFINETLNSGQKHGYRWMFHKCEAHNLKFRKEDVRIILSCLDAEGAYSRKARRLQRRNYHAEGPNNVWHLDGYDKLNLFGLCISGCVD